MTICMQCKHGEMVRNRVRKPPYNIKYIDPWVVPTCPVQHTMTDFVTGKEYLSGTMECATKNDDGRCCDYEEFEPNGD